METKGIEEKSIERIRELHKYVEGPHEILIKDLRVYFKRYYPEFFEKIPKDLENRFFYEIPESILFIVSNVKLEDEEIAKLEGYANEIMELKIPAEYLTEMISYIFGALTEIYIGIIGIELKEIPPLTNAVNKILSLILQIFMDKFAEKAIQTEKEKSEKEALKNVLKELSTPVLHTWEGIIVMPLIGTMTSDRAREAMEKILESVIEYKTKVAIIDITGVPVVDTMVADYLIKTVKAVKILGADAIITGISAEIASTLVRLGIDVEKLITRNTLREGLKYAISLIEAK